jgi:hypothetical protein
LDKWLRRTGAGKRHPPQLQDSVVDRMVAEVEHEPVVLRGFDELREAVPKSR